MQITDKKYNPRAVRSIYEYLQQHNKSNIGLPLSGLTAKMFRLSQQFIEYEKKMHEELHSVCRRLFSQLSAEMYNSMQEKLNFVSRIYEELKFILACVNFIKEIRSFGVNMCKPKVLPMRTKVCEIKDIYNLNLAYSIHEIYKNSNISALITYNDVSFNNKKPIVITGPNQGGKTTYIQAVGQAQVMFQLGLYVPGTKAFMSPVDGMFTHFPVEESEAEGMGRMGEECKRLAEIFRKADQYSLVLMNESFSSTSPGEGMYIARDVMLGFRMIGARAIYATHFHDLAADLEKMKAEIHGSSIIDSLVTGVKDNEEGREFVKGEGKEQGKLTERTYKVKRMPPQGRSFAAEIADYYGISMEKITKLLMERGMVLSGK